MNDNADNCVHLYTVRLHFCSPLRDTDMRLSGWYWQFSVGLNQGGGISDREGALHWGR